MANGSEFPEHIKHLPLETKVEVLYERVRNLDEDVKSLRKTLWAFLSALIAGAILFLFSVASGWIGPRTGPIHSIATSVWRWL